MALEEIAYLEKVELNNLSHPVLAASIVVNIGDYAGAISRYEDILQAVPKHAPLQMSYGHALKTVGRQSDSLPRTAERLRCNRRLARRTGVSQISRPLNSKTVKLKQCEKASIHRISTSRIVFICVFHWLRPWKTPASSTNRSTTTHVATR